MTATLPHLTAAQKIFRVGFQICIPSVFKYPPEQSDYYGRAVSGDPDVDRANMLEDEVIMITIDKLVAYYKRGLKSKIRFVDVHDAAMVYRIVVEHLSDWAHHLRTSVSPKQPNLEDLQYLDEIAHYTYIIARHLLTADDKPPELAEMFGFEPNSLMEEVFGAKDTTKTPVPITYHQPLVPDIADTLKHRVKSWR